MNSHFGFIQLLRNISVNRLINQTGNLHTNEDTLQLYKQQKSDTVNRNLCVGQNFSKILYDIIYIDVMNCVLKNMYLPIC